MNAVPDRIRHAGLLGMAAALALAGCETSMGSPARSPEAAIATVPLPWNEEVFYGMLQDRRDGLLYRTVRIGTQEWMAENLRHVPSPSVGICHGSDRSCERYGRFYRWSEAMLLPPSMDSLQASSSMTLPFDLCPEGWHIPSYEEVWLLKTSAAYAAGLDPSQAATVLKARAGWLERDSTRLGTDSLGFRMLASGSCYAGSFSTSCSGLGTEGSFWTRSESAFPDGKAFAASFVAGSTSFEPRQETKSTWRNVRCVRD